MRKIIIAGAGQMGRRVLQMVNRTYVQILGFSDNNAALWGSTVEGLPVFSMEEALSRQADGFLIAVTNEERTCALVEQLRCMGYCGEIRTLDSYRKELDIRSAVLLQLSERIRKVPGEIAELGVYQGEFAGRLNALFPERKLYLFDTFTGFDVRDIAAESSAGFSKAVQGDFSDTSVQTVLSKMNAPDQVVIRKGYFPETVAQVDAVFALVSLDADLYEPTLAGLRWFYPRVTPGGVMILHDYDNQRFSGVQAAAETYERENGRLLLVPVGDLHGSVVIMKP